MNTCKKQPLKTNIVLLFFIVLWLRPAYGQDSTYVDGIDFFKANHVQWVSQIPALKEDVKKQRKGWLKRLIFGEKKLGFLKPIQVIANSLEECIVLDQGAGTLFNYKKNALEIPKGFKKRQGEFISLVDACFLPNKDLLFTESGQDMIYRLSADQKKLDRFNNNLQLKRPTGIAHSRITNQIWVLETAKHQISILNSKGERVKIIGNRGTNAGEFNFPTAIWIDKEGIAYVVDALNYRVQLFDAAGNFISMFGENGNGTGYFANPNSIATDSFGHIYVVDALYHSVQIFDKQGNYLSNFGGQGHGNGQLWMPSGIFIDASNRIYIADSYNARIQLYQLNFTE